MMEKENVEGYFSKFVKVLKNVTDKITSLIAGIFKEPSKKFPDNQKILISLQEKIGEYVNTISSEEDKENRKSYENLMKELDTDFDKIKANLCGKFEADIYISILEKVSILCCGKITESSSKQQDNEILKLFRDIAKKILLILCRQDFQDDKYTKYLSAKDNLRSVSNVFNKEIDFKSLDEFYVLYQSIIDKISEKIFKNDEKNDFETINKNMILVKTEGEDDIDPKKKNQLKKIREVLENVNYYRQDIIRYDEKNQCLYACDGNDKTLVAYFGTDEKFSIPEGVTCIGEDAFVGNKSLKFIDLPESLISIEKGAFSGCSKLMYLKFPSNLQNIGDRAFAGCEKVMGILLPDSIKTIGETIFWDENEHLDEKDYKVLFLDNKLKNNPASLRLSYQLQGCIHYL